ncbi:MAG: hypothetical protein M1834_003412 [Cirrosporium novae-zelandiae]|nr:MAG: hypothetical protein M1834_003412 [Cirrosporium novae-zelandiae]
MPYESQARVQQPAPSFRCTAVINGTFEELSLESFMSKKQWVILVFVPMAFTFVCPTEIIGFNKALPEFAKRNTTVAFASTDSEHTLLAWNNAPRDNGGLGGVEVPLLSDKNHKMSKAYGVLLEDQGVALRGMFIIDPSGTLRQITINDLPVGRSVDEALRLIDAFQFTEKYGEVCPVNWHPGEKGIKVVVPTKEDPEGGVKRRKVDAYLLGGLTFLPVLLVFVLGYAFLTSSRYDRNHHAPFDSDGESLRQLGDDGFSLGSAIDTLAEKFRSSHEPDVAAGYFAVCREYVPGGINGKPPERTTPAGEVIATESPSVYQSMYRSIFDRKQTPTFDPAKGKTKNVKRASNVFFVVLRHCHLMLYDDSEQLEVRHVISLAHHHVSICGERDIIPEGELWIKRNAICLTRTPDSKGMLPPSKPFYLFSENCSEKEDFYFALLRHQEPQINNDDDDGSSPTPQLFEIQHIITLVQRLHSSEEHLETRWINALVGRAFLALYKTSEIEDFIRQKMMTKISRVKKPAFLSDIKVGKIDMGEGAPLITNPKLRDLTVDGECCVESDVSYTGNFRIEIAATARIDLGARFKAREVQLVLAVVLKRLEGRAIVRLKPPPSNRLWFSFEAMPKLEMAIEPIVSSRQITYGVIIRAIESRIREVIAETLVIPHWDDSPFLHTEGQRFRGGIWAKNEAPHSASNSTTKIQECQFQSKDGSGNSLPPASSAENQVDGKTRSMPSLSASPSTLMRSQTTAQSAGELYDSVDSGASSGTDKPVSSPLPRAPKAMRSNSFASAAHPVVSRSTAKVGAYRQNSSDERKSEATNSMIAISQRSQSPTPSDTPFGSPPDEPLIFNSESCSGNTGRGSRSSISSTASNSAEEYPAFTDLNVCKAFPESPMSVSLNKQPVPRHLAPSEESISTKPVGSSIQPPITANKRQSLSSIGTAAKKWGLGVLGRSEWKTSPEMPTQKKAGVSKLPIGRETPSPPKGISQFLSKSPTPSTTPISIPKRKPPLPPRLPTHGPLSNLDKLRLQTPPPLPARKVKSMSVESEEGIGDRLMVVGAPADPEPPSPNSSFTRNESENEEQVGTEEYMPSSKGGDVQSACNHSQDLSAQDNRLPFETDYRLMSASVEDEWRDLPSWSTAQEDEAITKNVWVNEDNRHP